jgi:hypothetical protein
VYVSINVNTNEYGLLHCSHHSAETKVKGKVNRRVIVFTNEYGRGNVN